MKLKKLNESWYIVEEATTDEKLRLVEMLSVYVPNYRFIPSVKAGIWDGKERFFETFEDKILVPAGIVFYLKKKINIEVELDKHILSEKEVNEFIKSLNLPFEPRDYQIEGFKHAIENKKAILRSATGSGKSLIIYLITAYLLKQNKKGIIIVPSVSLVEQLSNDFKDYNAFFEPHKIYSGKEKEWKSNVLITTYQSLSRHLHLLKDANFIINDECHNAKAESLKTILKTATKAEWKIGLTGTIPKEYYNKFALISSLGEIKNIITPRQLIEKGFATEVNVNLLYIHYSAVSKLKTYQEEIKFINEHYRRNEFVSKLALKLKNNNDNTLLLYNTIKHGDLILKIIFSKILNKNINEFTLKKSEKDKILLTQEDYNRDNVININNYNIYYIRGDVKANRREEIRKQIENIDGGLIIATYGTMSTGVNIKKLHNLILASTTKSSIRLNQSIGRGMRKHETKNEVKLFDIIDIIFNSKKYCQNHSQERIEEYLEHGYKINEKDIYLEN